MNRIRVRRGQCGIPIVKTYEVEKRSKKRSGTLGEMLVAYRLDHRYTQQEVSNAVYISRSAYIGYESGRHLPSIETLIRIADIYGVTLDLLIGRYPIL